MLDPEDIVDDGSPIELSEDPIILEDMPDEP
jgi:hypothetical protein